LGAERTVAKTTAKPYAGALGHTTGVSGWKSDEADTIAREDGRGNGV